MIYYMYYLFIIEIVRFVDANEHTMRAWFCSSTLYGQVWFLSLAVLFARNDCSHLGRWCCLRLRMHLAMC